MASVQTKRKLRSNRLEKTIEQDDAVNISSDELTFSVKDSSHRKSLSNQRRSLSSSVLTQKDIDEALRTPVKHTPGSMVKEIRRQLETQNHACCEISDAVPQKAITPVLARLKKGLSGNQLRCL